VLNRGIYLAPAQFEALFVSTAHSKDDLDKTIMAHSKEDLDKTIVAHRESMESILR
jgi:glutamate-1-semialdehyde aminotransferase